ncbi:hypothetical protein ACWDE0_39120 [Streptomyces sp. 900105755]
MSGAAGSQNRARQTAGTTALTFCFCAVYPQSVDALFEETSRRNMRMAAGKVLTERNAPAPARHSPEGEAAGHG